MYNVVSADVMTQNTKFLLIYAKIAFYSNMVFIF